MVAFFIEVVMKKEFSHYSVIYFVPDVMADERINIGVVACSGENVRAKFLSRWGRVQSFANDRDLTFLKEFVDGVVEWTGKGLILPGDRNDRPIIERLREISRGWKNSIQFTEPRGSLSDLDSCLADCVRVFLKG